MGKIASVYFHESTYGDYLTTRHFGALPSMGADTEIRVSGTELNDGQYRVVAISQQRVYVDPNPGFVSEGPVSCKIEKLYRR